MRRFTRNPVCGTKSHLAPFLSEFGRVLPLYPQQSLGRASTPGLGSPVVLRDPRAPRRFVDGRRGGCPSATSPGQRNVVTLARGGIFSRPIRICSSHTPVELGHLHILVDRARRFPKLTLIRYGQPLTLTRDPENPSDALGLTRAFQASLGGRTRAPPSHRGPILTHPGLRPIHHSSYL